MRILHVLLCAVLCIAMSSYTLYCQQASLRWKKQIHQDAVLKLDFSPTGKYVAVVSRDSVSVCETATGEVVKRYVYKRSKQDDDVIAIDAVFALSTPSVFILQVAPRPAYTYQARAKLIEWNFMTNETLARTDIIDSSINSGLSAYSSHIRSLHLTRSADYTTIIMGVSIHWSAIHHSGSFGYIATYNSMTHSLLAPRQNTLSLRYISSSQNANVIAYSGTSFHSRYTPGIGIYESSSSYTVSAYSFQKGALAYGGGSDSFTKETLPERIAVTPDGNYIALPTGLYDYRRSVFHHPLDLQQAKEFLFLPDGNHILAALQNSSHGAGILNVQSNTWIARFDKGGASSALAIVPNTSSFATGHSDGSVSLWNLSNGNNLPAAQFKTSFTANTTFTRVDAPVRFTNFTYPLAQHARFHWDFGDGETSTDFEPTHIYRKSGKYTVQLIAYNLNGKPDTTIKKEYIYVPELSPMIQWRQRYPGFALSDVSFSPDGERVFALARKPWKDKKIIMCDGQTGDTDALLINAPVEALTLLRNGSLATYGKQHNYNQSYGLDTTQHILTLCSPPHWVADDTVQLLDIEPDFAFRRDIGNQFLPPAGGPFLAASADGQHLVASVSGYISYQDGPLWDPVYDTTTYGSLLHIDRHKDTMYLVTSQDTAYQPVYAIAISPDGSTFAALRDSLRLYSTETNQTLATTFAPYGSPIAFSSDANHTLYVGTSVWKPNTQSLQPLPMRPAAAFAFLPPGNRYLLSVFDDPDSCAAIYDTQLNQYVYHYTSHSAGLTAVAISPDGKRFATGAKDGSLTVWNIPPQFHPPTTTVSSTGHQGQTSLAVAPNPSDGHNIRITYTLGTPQEVSISIRDMMGRTVAQVHKGVQQAGECSMEIDITRHSGTILAPGVYICTVQSQEGVFSAPFLVLH